ncbi:MAG TPA: HlyD family secretion protein [Pirellulales bacterium]|jgi:multidrug resistance efflux pump|nr:HlyD family secretion protein [Pirellulales bacterium]
MLLMTALPKPAGVVAGAMARVGRSLVGLWRSFLFWLLLTLAVIVIVVAYFVAADRSTPLTTDAYVQAYVVQVAPQVGGQVIRVHVHEGQQVEAGQPLFELDPRPFEHKVALFQAKLVETQYHIKQLQAQLAAAKAEQRQLTAEADYARVVHRQEKEIFDRESTTERKYVDAVQKLRAAEAAVERSASLVDDVESALAARIGTVHASVAQVQAELAEAELNLGYSKVVAPCSGVITNLQLTEGSYAHVGQAVLTCIDTRHWLVVANFRERSLEQMRPGQPALVAFQAIPGKLFPAQVQVLGVGVSQGQGIPSGMLPDVKSQTMWIPADQRFQVRLVLDPSQQLQDVPLRVGMTGSVSVYIGNDRLLTRVTRALHTILAWFYYL